MLWAQSATKDYIRASVREEQSATDNYQYQLLIREVIQQYQLDFMGEKSSCSKFNQSHFGENIRVFEKTLGGTQWNISEHSQRISFKI